MAQAMAQAADAMAASASAVKSAERTLRIFEAFAQARSVDIPVSACHALVRKLAALGYLYEIGPRRGYYPTLRWLDYARVIARHDPLIERMTPLMEDLARASGENAPDVHALAVPVELAGECHALAIAGPVHRMDAALSTHAKRLLLASRRSQRR